MRKGTVFTLHGYQIWIALPKPQETMEPAFFHAAPAELPQWKTADASYTLICGNAFWEGSPGAPLFRVISVGGKNLWGRQTSIWRKVLRGEIGIVVVSGVVEACSTGIPVGSILYSKAGETCEISCDAETHLMVFGGEPLPEERLIHWNFVASSRSKIEAARQQWKDKTFPMMAGEKSYIPLPESKSPLKN